MRFGRGVDDDGVSPRLHPRSLGLAEAVCHHTQLNLRPWLVL